MDPIIRRSLEAQISSEILSVEPVSGGDINEAYRINTPDGPFFIKMNASSNGVALLNSEVSGLRELRNSTAVRVPLTVGFNEVRNCGMLILEWINKGVPDKSSYEALGRNLARMHKCFGSQFGNVPDNYIGSLPQINASYPDFESFYAECRIIPQVRMAVNNGYLEKHATGLFEKFLQKCAALMPDERPSLVHGDLWAGNHMIDESGKPVFIDPSVSYNHRETDLAMMRLFGGYPQHTFNAYNEYFPLMPEWEERSDVFQLYYLLVHLNLFGNSYHSSVMRIAHKYT